MEHIKENLKHDYNLAVEYFNTKDFKSFFRNIRPAIESLAQLMIYDMLDSDEDAMGLIDGTKDIDEDDFSILDYPRFRKPKGTAFIIIMMKVFYQKHHIRRNNNDDSKLELKQKIDSYTSILKASFSLASELGSHSTTSKLDTFVQSINCASSIVGIFDSIKCNKLASHSFISFINSLDSFNFVQDNVLESAKHEIETLTNELKMKEEAFNVAKQQQIEAERRLSEEKNALRTREAEIEVIKNKHQQDIQKKQEEINRLTEERKKVEHEKDEAFRQISEAKIENEQIKAENIALSAKVESMATEEHEDVVDTQDSNQEEDWSLDDLFNFSEEGIPVESTISARSDERKVPEELTDRKLKKALKLANQGLSPNQIMNETNWRPINTYARLSQLVEKGYFPASRFVSNDIYNIIMESIKEIGSDSDNKDIRDNCSLTVALWQVNMVLSELNYKGEVILPHNSKDDTQDRFKQYIEDCFLLDTRPSMVLLESDTDNNEPEIVIELTVSRRVTTFGVAVWFMHSLPEGQLLSDELLKDYKKFERSISGSVYFVLGIGEDPEHPRDLYVIPISEMRTGKKHNTDNLNSYRHQKTVGNFRYIAGTNELCFIPSRKK